MPVYSNAQKLGAEFVGTAILLATVVGSGIMGETLSGGNVAIALLGNTIPTGAILIVLITLFRSVSGAHFNPAVTLVFRLRGDVENMTSMQYVIVQMLGGIVGVWTAHVMFGLDIFQLSEKVRTGPDQWFAEIVATFGLVLVILGTLRSRPEFVPGAVGFYITAAYWFTASTSFANPAVTIARSLSNTFAGIMPADMPMFILAQIIGAITALAYCNWQFGKGKNG